jgi:ferredoxin-NADP reductase
VWIIHSKNKKGIIMRAKDLVPILAENLNMPAVTAFQIDRSLAENGYRAKGRGELGRITGALLAGLVQNMDAHYFLCGPVQFMAEIQTSLEQQDVLADQIHFETFGPVG